MKIALATDHAGYDLKESIKLFLEDEGHEVIDFGADSEESDDDYPDFIRPAAEAVAVGDAERAIIFGKSGQGEAMCANRIKGVRAALFYGCDAETVVLSREHNDSNVLSIGAAFTSEDEAIETVTIWLDTAFSGAERHVRRIKKLDL